MSTFEGIFLLHFFLCAVIDIRYVHIKNYENISRLEGVMLLSTSEAIFLLLP